MPFRLRDPPTTYPTRKWKSIHRQPIARYCGSRSRLHAARASTGVMAIQNHPGPGPVPVLGSTSELAIPPVALATFGIRTRKSDHPSEPEDDPGPTDPRQERYPKRVEPPTANRPWRSDEDKRQYDGRQEADR
jgi:hypothetical protein